MWLLGGGEGVSDRIRFSASAFASAFASEEEEAGGAGTRIPEVFFLSFFPHTIFLFFAVVFLLVEDEPPPRPKKLRMSMTIVHTRRERLEFRKKERAS